jgi:arylsulfatase A-like enzyme
MKILFDRLRATALLGSLLLGTLPSCADREPEPSAPRLVILYAPCTLSKSFLTPYAPEIGLTPNLARFAEDSVVFHRHTTESGHSGSAFASIFSGTQADRHGIHDHPRHLPDELFLIGEAFAEGGYETFFWSGHQMASASLNYGQGIAPENTIESLREGSTPRTLTGNDRRFGTILDRLSKDPDYRAFVQVNFTLTHGPYHQNFAPSHLVEFFRDFPDEHRGVSNQEFTRFLDLYDAHRHELQYDFPATVAELGLSSDEVGKLAVVIKACYRCSVHGLDTLFGKYLDRIDRSGLRDETLIAFTADHGEILHRDNALFRWTHGQQLAPEYLDVPLIIRSPRHGLAGTRYDAVTRSIDLYPTLAGLCGVSVPPEAGVQGEDLSDVLLGRELPPDLPAYSHTVLLSKHRWEDSEEWELYRRYFPRWEPELSWVRLRTGDLAAKWRRGEDGGWRTEIFDLEADPGETRDLFDPSDPSHAELTRKLKAYKARLVEGFHATIDRGDVPEDEALQRLKDLGYVR